jgi:SPP1 family predicted phage head-tail adaptor
VLTGRMRHTVTLQTRSTTKDAVGQQVDTWTTLGKVIASIDPVRGTEYFTASGENSDVTHKIVCRARNDITPRPYDRAVFGSRTFNIKAILDIAETGRYWEMMAVELLSTT